MFYKQKSHLPPTLSLSLARAFSFSVVHIVLCLREKIAFGIGCSRKSEKIQPLPIPSFSEKFLSRCERKLFTFSVLNRSKLLQFPHGIVSIFFLSASWFRNDFTIPPVKRRIAFDHIMLCPCYFLSYIHRHFIWTIFGRLDLRFGQSANILWLLYDTKYNTLLFDFQPQE